MRPKKTITKTGKIVWIIVIDAPQVNGKRSQLKLRAPTRTALLDKVSETRVAMSRGTFVTRNTTTLAEYLRQKWLPALRATGMQPSTLDSYGRNLEGHVIRRIGDVRLQNLDTPTLDALYATLAESGRLDGRGGLSKRTVRYVHTIVSKSLQDAVRWNLLAVNPASRAKPPSAKAAKAPPMKTWTGAELGRFLRHVEHEPLYPVFHVAATTGMRRGEVLGLRWSDVDLDTATASVRQTVLAVHHEVVISPRTKTDRSRSLSLDVSTVTVLRKHRASYLQSRLARGLPEDKHGLVFAHADGSPLHPETVVKVFGRRAATSGLPRIRFHDIRHTWATLALQSNIHVKVVSERLGHASVGITLDTYSHAIPAMESEAAEKVAELIFRDSP